MSTSNFKKISLNLCYLSAKTNFEVEKYNLLDSPELLQAQSFELSDSEDLFEPYQLDHCTVSPHY